ncbi:MAG: RNA polymerase subunit sigma, partial [Ruminococcus sp.]|nr:RNA polymerase subunit sigma [Ruminococcus sp.]
MDVSAKELVSKVYRAKKDSQAADELIETYMPFIKSETAKFLKRSPDNSDDELSIAMFAFYEAIRNYSRLKGAFLKFASLQIRSRLIDNFRKEKRNSGLISLDSSADDNDKNELIDTISDDHDDYEEHELREATRNEIE